MHDELETAPEKRDAKNKHEIQTPQKPKVTAGKPMEKGRRECVAVASPSFFFSQLSELFWPA
jgi:hypothetical protein